jgi:hypothetical protein
MGDGSANKKGNAMKVQNFAAKNERIRTDFAALKRSDPNRSGPAAIRIRP